MTLSKISRLFWFGCLMMTLAGCSLPTSTLTGNLSSSILDSDDPDTIKQALPSYLLTLDALLKDSESAELYWSAAKLNSAYSGQFSSNMRQKKRLADKAWRYAKLAACYEDDDWCGVETLTQGELGTLLKSRDQDDIDTLFQLGSVWASWLEANSDNWDAVAQLGKIQLFMQRVIELDETHELGSAHVYLGALATIVPAALGGKPEVGKQHFEAAIRLSEDRNLMAKVMYAERYARLVFDRELHDRLLQEVIDASSHEPGWTLANTLAQEKARELLESADNYF